MEFFLRRYFTPGDCIYDPFVGSGTTLVEANTFGADAIGCDISAFNCLLTRVKTTQYKLGALEMGLRAVLEEARREGPSTDLNRANAWLHTGTRLARWASFSATARSRPGGWTSQALGVASVILSRAGPVGSSHDALRPRLPERPCHE